MTNQCTGCAGGPINITCQMCLRAEVERLTDILIACCNASGGQAIKGVSVDFLAHVPAEIAGRIERLARLLENEKIESGRLRDLNGQKQNDLDVANHNLEAWAKRGEHWLTETERLTRERDEVNKDSTHCLEQLSLVCIERDQLREQLEAANAKLELASLALAKREPELLTETRTNWKEATDATDR